MLLMIAVALSSAQPILLMMHVLVLSIFHSF